MLKEIHLKMLSAPHEQAEVITEQLMSYLENDQEEIQAATPICTATIAFAIMHIPD